MADDRMRRDMGLLTLGALMGGLLGLVGNLWTAYYMKWLETRIEEWMWLPITLMLTIALVVGFTYLAVWAIRQIRVH